MPIKCVYIIIYNMINQLQLVGNLYVNLNEIIRVKM